MGLFGRDKNDLVTIGSLILNHNYQYPNHIFKLCDYFIIDKLLCFDTLDICIFQRNTIFTSENTGLKRQSASNRIISKKGKKSTKRDDPMNNEKKEL